MDILFSPPVAIIIYVVLVSVLAGVGKQLSPSRPSPLKSSTYASGEAAPKRMAVPGYRPFFVVALFFAILHLGVLLLGSGGFTGAAIIYVIGLGLALVALILG